MHFLHFVHKIVINQSIFYFMHKSIESRTHYKKGKDNDRKRKQETEHNADIHDKLSK